MTATLTPAPASARKVLPRGGFGRGLSGVLTACVGVLGIWAGMLGLFGAARPIHIGWLLPLSGVWLDLDPLGGFFMMVIGAIAAPVGVYVIGYRHHLSAVPLAVLPLFVAAMLLVPAAASVSTFLLAWELMALASLVLVLADHTRPEVRTAGRLYAVMTQLGFVTVLIALMVLSAAGGADRFADMDMAQVPDAARTAVFVLTVAGFGSKAGLAPLHAWLPRAHPEAPSPVSALMSAAMVNLGIYGIVRFDLQLLGPGPRWWGLTLVVVGGLSALYGVLQASVATDLKRLLAYSTTENMGLITARDVQEPGVSGCRIGARGDRAARPGPARRAGPADARDHDPVRGGRAGRFGPAAGCRLRQRVVVGSIADPRGCRRHGRVIDRPARGRGGRLDGRPRGGGDGQGVRHRVLGPPALRARR